MDPQTTLGPLCTEGALDFAESQMKMAVDGGAKVLLGGKRATARATFLEPTILTEHYPGEPSLP